MCAAVETVFPSALPEVCDLLEAPTLPPVTVLARTLVNELDAIEEPFVLVLDDVHRIRERAVAARLYVTKHTVNHHLKRIYRKLGVSGRRQAVKRAAELGILQRDDTL